MATAFFSPASSLFLKTSNVLSTAVDAHILTAVGVSLFVPILILFCVNGKDGNDKAMLTYRNANPISTYTKFTLSLRGHCKETVQSLGARIAELLDTDSVVNAVPGTGSFVRRSLEDIFHVTEREPKFHDISTEHPVHVFMSQDEEVVWIFVDHSVADGLGMYNDVIAPILNNPRFTLARRPSYIPGLLELHQLYVLGRLATQYVTAPPPLERLEKSEQYPVCHALDLASVKGVAKANNIPVTALIISILVTHFRRALTVRRDTLRICVSYAFQRGKGGYNNYSFILIKCHAGDSVLQTAKGVAAQIFKGRRQINTMYYLLQKTGIPFVDVQSMVKKNLCDAYVAATFVPEEGDGRKNGIASCVSEHYSISTGCNMTAMSIGEKICVSTKVGLKAIDEKLFSDTMAIQ
jgi:hypothetical protein